MIHQVVAVVSYLKQHQKDKFKDDEVRRRKVKKDIQKEEKNSHSNYLYVANRYPRYHIFFPPAT